MSTTEEDVRAALQGFAEVKGQLANITLLIQNSQTSTHQRIDDLRKTVETRFDGVEERLTRVEENERTTALKASASGALMGAVVSGAVALLAHKFGN